MKVLSIFIFIFFLSGCTTSQPPFPKVSNSLQVRVSELERQLSQRDQEIEELKYEVKELAYQVESLDTDSVIEPPETFKSSSDSSLQKLRKKSTQNIKDKKIIRVSAAPKQVQIALKNSGYYKGSIDGKIGSQTQKAIKKFQKDHDLKSDGVVGKKTWFEMKNYLE